MNRLIRAAAAIAFIAMSTGSAIAADVELADGTVLSESPSFIVTYVEVGAGSADVAARLIKDHTAASKKDAGNIRFEALRRIGRQNHFVILEAWNDRAARDAHAKADHTVAFRKALQPLLYNPYDERPHVGLVAADPAKIGMAGGDMVFAITHVDIIPPEQFPPCERQVNKAGPCGNALVEKLVTDSRKHSGNIRFDALTQANRPNHMTVVEMWESAEAAAAHQMTSDVKLFRDALSGIVPGSGVNPDPLFVLNPMTGSLYDERLYKLL